MRDEDCAGGARCVVGACEAWFGLGASDFAPRRTRVVWSSGGGGISNGGGRSPSMALDGADRPVVAWMGGLNTDIYVGRYNGQGWESVGGSSGDGGGVSDNSGFSADPALALDGAGLPVVAWEDSTSGNSEIYVARFDGVGWQGVGASGATGGGVSNNPGYSGTVSLALDVAGQPFIAWSDRTSGVDEIYVAHFDGANWGPVGANSTSGGGVSAHPEFSSSPSLVVDIADNPVIAWTQVNASNYEIYVARFDGTSWKEVGPSSASGGGISNDAGISEFPSLALDGTGNPYVAWRDRTAGEIYVTHFDGIGWQPVGASGASGGGLSANAGDSRAPVVAVDGSDRPLVAWHDDDSGINQIYIARFDGAAWEAVGMSGSSGGGVSNNAGSSTEVAIDLNSDANPTLVWGDLSSGTSEIYAMSFDGTVWQPVGSGTGMGGALSNSSGMSQAPSIALDDSLNPFVVWQDDSSGIEEIYAARFDGAQWRSLGTSSNALGGISDTGGQSVGPKVALDSTGRPIVIWAEDGFQIFATAFDGSSWVPVGASGTSAGGISPTLSFSRNPVLAITSADNPVVAWEDEVSGNYEIYVTAFDGTAWQPVGASSTSGGGISNTSNISTRCTIALDGGDNPVVAWSDLSSGNAEIYVARFDGANWLPVGASGASGGGVSNTPGQSTSPSIALDAAGDPTVAWNELSAGGAEIYVARFDGSDWQPVGPSGASGSGISNTAPFSGAPSLAIDATGAPVIAWQGARSGTSEVYFSRFDGVNWQPQGTSPSWTIVSNSGANSQGAALVSRGERECIAWFEGGSTSTEILVRCSDL